MALRLQAWRRRHLGVRRDGVTLPAFLSPAVSFLYGQDRLGWWDSVH